MPLITTLQEEREKIDELLRKIDYEEDFEMGISFEDRHQIWNPIKSFLTQSHIRLLESLRQELPKEKEEYYNCARPTCIDIHDRMCEHIGEWTGHNKLLSTTHQLLDNAIKSIKI